MASARLKYLKSLAPGRIPMLNRRGFTTEVLDQVSRDFVDLAVKLGDPVLDLGCGYGVASLEVLRGGGRVHACDMDLRHLDILAEEAGADLGQRMTLITGELPDIPFEASSFAAILCSRVLHFLTGADVTRAIAGMFDWLRPGGTLFAIVDSPYCGVLAKVAAQYERRKAEGDPWPGFFEDHGALALNNPDVPMHPKFIHPMDPETLRRVCEETGFVVRRAEYIGRVEKRLSTDPLGRDHAVVVAERP